MAPPKAMPIKAVEVDKESWKKGIASGTFMRRSDQVIFVGSLNALVDTLPDGDKKAGFKKALAGNSDEFFTPGGKAKDEFKDTIADIMAESLGDRTAVVNGGMGKRYIVYGKDDGKGGLTVNAVLPAEALRLLNPLEAIKVKNNAATVSDVKDLRELAEKMMKDGVAVKGGITQPGAFRVVRADKNSLKDVLDKTVAKTPEEQAVFTGRLKAIVSEMPGGVQKQTLDKALAADPKTMFNADGTLTKGFKDTYATVLAKGLGEQLITGVDSEGNRYMVFGSASLVGGMRTNAILPVSAIEKGDPLSTLKVRRNAGIITSEAQLPQIIETINMSGKTPVGTMPERAGPVFPPPKEGKAPLAEPVPEPAPAPVPAPAPAIVPPAPAVAPVVTGNKRMLEPRKPWYERLMNKNTLIGSLLGVLGGGLIGGPMGMFLGLLLGGLGGSFLSGNNPFTDKETATLAPNDTQVQVRDKDGKAPVMELTMAAGEPGKKMIISGAASKDGKAFEITDSAIVSNVPGVPVERRRNNPPLRVAMDADGFVDTVKIYDAVGQKVPPVLRRATTVKPVAALPEPVIDPKAAGFEQGDYGVDGRRYVSYLDAKDGMEYTLVGKVDMASRKFAVESVVVRSTAEGGISKELTEPLPAPFDVDGKGKVNIADKGVQDTVRAWSAEAKKAFGAAPIPDIASVEKPVRKVDADMAPPERGADPYTDLALLDAFLEKKGRGSDATTYLAAPAKKPEAEVSRTK